RDTRCFQRPPARPAQTPRHPANRLAREYPPPSHPVHAPSPAPLLRWQTARPPRQPVTARVDRPRPPVPPVRRSCADLLWLPGWNGGGGRPGGVLRPLLLQPGRELQRMPQLGGGFIDREAWASRRQLDDVAVGVGGIDAPEVDAIHDWRDAQSRL